MNKKSFLFKNTENQNNIFDFLKDKLHNEKKIRIPDGFLRKYIEEGFVRVDAVPCKKIKQNIVSGQTVSIVLKIPDLKKFTRPPKIQFQFGKDNILYEDDDLIVVNKPYGIPTHSTLDPDRDHLVAGLKRYLKERDQKSPYIGIHHRLDKDTSGVILFTKNPDVNSFVGNLFMQRNIEKHYIALTKRIKLDKKTFKMESHVGRSSKDKRKMISLRSGGDYALTHFKVLYEINNYYVMECKPETGRTHQIRVHLLDKNMPILGDTVYMKDGNEKHSRLFLHAAKLSFPHPRTQKKIEIKSPIPDEFFNVVGKFDF